LAQVVNHEKVFMSQSLIRYLNVDGILGEDIVSPLDHLIAILLREIATIRINGRLERALLSGRSPS
jgi:hypothetical protein